MTVFCGEPTCVQERTDTIVNRIVLVEVLSPGTALMDRNEQLMEYTQIDTLDTYLLVAQDGAGIERYMRHERGQWRYPRVSGLDADIALPSIDCTPALAKVYQKVSFDEPDSKADSSSA